MNRFESHAELEPLYTPLRNPRRELASQHIAAGMKPFQAMKLAGYDKPSEPNARRLRNSTDVRRRVLAIWEKGAELAGVSAGKVVAEEALIAYFNVGDVIQRDDDGMPILGEDGNPRIDMKLMTREHWAAVAGFHPKEGIKFYDKTAMLKDLRAHCGGGAASKVELTGKDGGPVAYVDLSKLSDEQLAALEPVLAALAGPGPSLGAGEAREGAASG